MRLCFHFFFSFQWKYSNRYPDAVDDIIPAVEAFQMEFRTVMVVQRDNSSNQDKILHAILSALNLCIPTASTFDHNSGVPPSISATAAASTASTLNLNSLITGSRITCLPTAGPSEVRQEEP